MRIGIDLGGTKIEGIVMDAAGTTLARQRDQTPVSAGYPAVVEAIAHMVESLEREVKTTCSVGVGTPGATSALSGKMKNCNLLCVNGQPLQVDLEARLARPLRLANDANCFTLSEALDGAAADKAVVFGVILGTGVGGGISFAGRAHNGPNAIAGEWGHTPLEADGPKCYCGRQGCVETLLSGPGMMADYRRAGGVMAASPTDIARIAAVAGEAQATATMARYLDRLGRALATVIDILDPDAIVLGGGLSHMAQLYTAGPAAILAHLFSDDLRTPLLQNRHGDSSGVRGAALLW